MRVKTVSAIAAASLVLTACGGGSSSDQTSATTAPQTDQTTTTPPATTPEQAESDTTAANGSQDSSTTTMAETTTTTVPTPVVVFELATLPQLVADAVAATQGEGDALEVAERLGGFAFEIAPPDGSVLHELSTTMFGSADSARWSYRYGVIAAGGVVEDVDISLDDNGPGAVALAAYYDPIMGALGFERNGSTGSDPGDPGGPNSLNHVYDPADEQLLLNGVEGRVPNVKIWVDEDVTGGSYSDDIEIQGGYWFDYDFQVPPGAVASPLLSEIAAAVPVPVGALLTDARLSLHKRFEDSFSYDLGPAYVTISLTWQLPEGSHDQAMAYYADSATFEGNNTFVIGEASFFDATIYEPSEWGETFDGHGMDLMMLERYAASLELTEDDDGTVELELDIELNPTDQVRAASD
ncbi:MAG: hypothetical protein R2770_03470 [Acidimicrobiales bacterium]